MRTPKSNSRARSTTDDAQELDRQLMVQMQMYPETIEDVSVEPSVELTVSATDESVVTIENTAEVLGVGGIFSTIIALAAVAMC